MTDITEATLRSLYAGLAAQGTLHDFDYSDLDDESRLGLTRDLERCRVVLNDQALSFDDLLTMLCRHMLNCNE